MNYKELTAKDLREMLDSGEVTAIELLKEAKKVIDEKNKRCKCFY